MANIDAEVLAAHLREEMAEMIALLPAVRRRAHDADCVDAVARCAYRQMRSAQNLAAFAQLCGTPPVARGFCLSALVESFGQGARSICPAVDLEIIAPAIPVWTVGSQRLYAVCLGNLIANSILYGSERPHIVLRTEQTADSSTLIITDDGKGFYPAQLERACQPFASADPYNDGAPAPGLGLGLTIVQRYAACYGGCLVAQSEFGTGSTLALRTAATTAGTMPPAACFLTDRCSTLYVQLASVCRLPV